MFEHFEVDSNCIKMLKARFGRLLRLTAALELVIMMAWGLGLGLVPSPGAEAASPPADNSKVTKRVLFINSYSRDYATVPVVVNQVEQELKGLATLQYVFMNTKNLDLDFAVAQTKRELEYLQGKFDYRFDLIITGDDDALDFVRRYRTEYFQGIPVIFENVNSEKKVQEAIKDPLMAGVAETFPVQETLRIAWKLNPKAQRVVMVTDGTLSSLGTEEQLEAVKNDFQPLDFQPLKTTQYTTGRLQKILGSYGEETILFFNMISLDGSGVHYNIATGVNFVTTAAKIPVFKSDEAGIGEGLLGGCALSYESIGRLTGQMARQVLTGAKTPRELGYTRGDYNYKFDVKVMKRFQIQKNQLPEKTLYVNDPPTFYQQHEAVLRPISILLLLMVITWLLYDRRKNRLFNERLSQTKAEAKAAELANKAKTDFLSRMSHDIRTPLNAIIGLTDLAGDDLENPPRMADNLRKIHSSSLILLSLLNDVLDVSRIESGRMVLHPEPYSLPEFFSQIHAMFDEQCRRRGQHFEVVTSGESYIVMLDKVRFVQLIGNLLTNAVKFTKDGGHIRLEVQCFPVEADTGTPVPLVEERLAGAALPRLIRRKRNGYAGTGALDGSLSGKVMPCTLIVSDDGPGMTAEFQKKMFEPFSQERPVISAIEGGSGLGLAIVKKIVELMQGRIQVQSAPGQGTRFTLQFRLRLAEGAELEQDELEQAGSLEQAETDVQAETAAQVEKTAQVETAEQAEKTVQVETAEPRGQAESAGQGRPAANRPQRASTEVDFTNCRILLVEDHPLNAEITTRMLAKKGIQVELAVNGQEAVAKFGQSDQNYYDLILMDIRMPVMDGREATKEIRRLCRLDAMTVPIIAMTADAFDGDVNRSLACGMNAQLNKPVEPQGLYRILAQYCQGKAPRKN